MRSSSSSLGLQGKDGRRRQHSPSGSVINANKLLRPTSYGVVKKCPLCGTQILQVNSVYCQGCAYRKGICASCGKPIHDLSIYRQRDV